MDTKHPRARILVVEDDPVNAHLMRDGLELLGYAVDCALDGNLGVTMACTREYAAVLLDLHLPEYDGVEVLHMLRRRHPVKPTPVLVVTGDTAGSRLGDLNREGIDGYFTKPIDFVALARELARVAPGSAAA